MAKSERETVDGHDQVRKKVARYDQERETVGGHDQKRERQSMFITR